MFPTLTRRKFWQYGAVSVTGGVLAPGTGRLNAAATGKVTPRGSADAVIFLNLVGGPSQMDTFDFKQYKFTPEDLAVKAHPLGIQWPHGLLPKTAGILKHAALVRSMAAWETLHNLGQFYLQVGHAFNAARAKEMPSIGSVVAHEMLAKAKASDFLPPFVSMNFPAGAVNGTLIREGYFDSSTAPLTLDVRKGGNMPFLLKDDYRDRFASRLDFLRSFDSSRQLEGSGVNKLVREWDSFSKSAERMIRSPKVAGIFDLKEADRQRYGSSAFGDACMIARNMVDSGGGARFILVNQGGWDHHGDIYGKSNKGTMEDRRARGGLYSNCGELDPALASLAADLEASGKLERTLVCVMGEFGRTPGPLTDIQGRDHWPNVRCGLFLGGGVKGGKVIGATDDQGAKITKFEWHKNRPIYPEDVTATIYSALGIDWTKKLGGAPSGREFIYVEDMSPTGFIGSTEIRELFA
ncbi:MAG: DUF1501 domain-containing protein [Acidobacteria bacterium]|nr:DUF1501 domain-containing protein [Acidobacteriota bacterium]